MMTVGLLATRLMDEVPGIGPREARKRIARAIKEVCELHPWSHLIAQYALQTEDSYNTGTVAVVNGSTSVTLTSGTWQTSWSTAPSSRKIVIQGRAEPYTITINTSTTGTLSDPFIGATNSVATYRMFRDTYPLPSDCDYGKIMTLWDVLNNRAMYFRDFPFFIRRKNEAQGIVGTPVEYALVGMTTEQPPRPQIEFGWESPSVATTYRLWYFKRPAFPSADGDYPNFPERFENLHWLRAAIDIGLSARTPNKNVPQWKAQYDELLLQAKAEMDGGAAVDREVQSVYLGRQQGIYAGPSNPDFQNNARYLG